MSRVLPVLFNTDMVRAILRGISPKTETRRAIKGYIPSDAMFGYTAFTPKGYISCRGTFADGYGEEFFKLPCQKGDILYVRETWSFLPCVECMDEGPACSIDPVVYDDGDSESEGCFVYKTSHPRPERVSWTPSIHMPKQAARIWLKVMDVRAERLQDITGAEILAEGVANKQSNPAMGKRWENMQKIEFERLWNSTIKKSNRGIYDWASNPWVWVIEFERCERPEGVKKNG